jgi:hypothetical protein
MGLEDLNIKSTLKEPTDIGKKTNKDFRQQIIKRDVNPDILKETDSMLNEDELSLKRKIFKLPKMEALVHGDPKLSAVYEKLAVEGRDKYGYHWNETLMNIIFNDYVLNSPKYLQKYKMTVPIKKKRRDDSGINQLKKKIKKQKGLPVEDEKPKEKNEGWDVERDGIRRTERTYDTMEMPLKENQNSEYLDITTPIGSNDDKLFVSVVNKGIDSHLEGFTKSKFDVKDTSIGQRRIFKFHRSELPILVRRLEEIGDENALQWAEDIKNEGNNDMTETTGAAGAGAYAPALDKKLEETTTSASSGQYSTPKAWSKDGKPANNKPAWKGGLVLETALKDGSYLTDSKVFQEYIKALNEGVEDDPCWDGYEMVGMKEKDGKEVPNCVPEGMTSPNDDSRVPMAEEEMDEAFFGMGGNAANLKLKISDLLTANKDLFNRIKKFHSEMDDKALILQFMENSKRVPIKELISDPDRYGQGLVSMLAQYSAIVDRGLQNNPAIAKQLKTIGAIIDPQILKSMSNESVEMNEHHASTKEDKIAFILQNKDKVFQGNVSPTVEQDLAAMSDAEVDALYKSAESAMGVTESTEMVDEGFKGLKLTDLYDLGTKLVYAKSSQEVRDAIRQFTGLNNVSEEDLLDTAKIIRSNNRAMASSDSEARENISLLDEIIHYLSQDTSWKEKIGEANMDEKAVSKNQQQFMGMVRAAQKGEMENPSPAVAKAAASMKPSDVKDFASTSHEGLPEKVEEATGFNKVVKGKVEPKPVKTGDSTKQWKQPVKESMIDPQNPSMVSGNGTSMVKEPSAPAAPAVSSVGGVGESLEESINKELEFYKKHLNKLNQMVNEERRHPALVNLDRVKDANEKNFKSDIKDSNIGDVIDMESQPMASELTQEVGDNPYKLAQDIEKEMLKKTKGEALKNVGNSANEEGDEIPKRNLSKEEMLAVAMNRGKGMQDIVYDNEPSEKFEKRMKADLGDDIYKLRQDKMKYQAKAPMYNKDTQPTDIGNEVEENNKYKKGFNNESIAGRYTDEFGKKKFIDFKLNETIEIGKVDSSYQQVSTDGMGNTYTSKIEENRSYNDFTNSYNLFHKNGKVFRVKKSQSINEGVEKQAPKIENMDKMKHLMGYNPSKYVVNKKIK